MLTRFQKYRKPLFLLLLVAYLGSTFQQPIFEAIHVLSHLSDITHGEYHHHSHSYYQEINIDHEHPLLAAFEQEKNQENHPFPVEQETKKKVELSPSQYNFDPSDSTWIPNNFLFLMASSLFQKEDPSPPPRVV